MAKLLRFCSFLLLFSILINLLPQAVFSINDTEKKSTCIEIDQAYLEEMYALGFSEDDVIALADWNLRIIHASSMQEIDILMDEYNDITRKTSINTTAYSNAIYTDTGGTLILDYIGEYNPVSQVIYTKIVYLPIDQVLFYHTAMNSENFVDYIMDEFLSFGVSIVTAKIAAAIASHLCIPKDGLTWLIGSALGVTVWTLQNLDKWDLDDAITNSITGKVKLEYYYLHSIGYPFFMSVYNYEPWNSQYIEIPDDYDYIWYSDIYEYNNELHTHNLTYTCNNNGSHTISCNSCSEVASEDCSIFLYCAGLDKHREKCQYCDYLSPLEACHVQYATDNNGYHTVSCIDCNNVRTEACHPKYHAFSSNRHGIDCALCDYHFSSENCTYDYTSNGDGTHTGSCRYCTNTRTASCAYIAEYDANGRHYNRCKHCDAGHYADCTPGYTYTGSGTNHTHITACRSCGHVVDDDPQACTFAYRYHGVVNGHNTHVRACTQCGHIQAGPTQCTYIGPKPCLACGSIQGGGALNNVEEDFTEN